MVPGQPWPRITSHHVSWRVIMWTLNSPPHLDRAEYWAISTYPVTQTIGKVLRLITISCAIVRKTDCEVMSGNTLYKTQTRNDQAEKSPQNILLLFSYCQWWTRGFVIFRRAQQGMATNIKVSLLFYLMSGVPAVHWSQWLMWWAVILWNYEPPSQIVYSWPSGWVSLRTGHNPP